MTRISLQLLACACAAAGATSAFAQPYPTRLVRIVVGFAPGGSMDVVARIAADRLRESLGQQVIVENRAGASGSIAADALAKAAPDGHTIMLAGGGTLAIRQKLELKLPYDAQRDFAPVIQVANLPLLLVVPTSLPVKSVKELVTLARARPGQLNFSSSGVGSTTHLSGEMLKALAKIELTHVPYKGSSQMLPDLVAGQISLAFDQITTTQPYIAAGKLRALAISTPKRSRLMPALPTIAEAGVPGYEAISWNGFVVPAATPRTIVERINDETVKLLNTTSTAERLASIGAEPAGGTAEQFAAFIKAESIRWGRLIDRLGIKPQ
ncbi:MAG TPA: tripartite tricarboxylate transporter substrate binding protein [Burkholderiales bacterium]|nr:tripartite tricarboxylate transporter substrate binding protein [Burkholderiales bacterium]